MEAAAHSAGDYARERYRKAIRRYRRRTRRDFLALLALAVLPSLLISLAVGLDWWSYVVGLAAGCLLTLAVSVHDEPPEFIAKWGRGAAGEEKTGEVLAALVAKGWKVKHDIELRRGNVDHLVLSPTGCAFLLETKTLVGSVRLEHGQLTTRYVDDPEEVRRHDLAEPMHRRVESVSKLWAARVKGSAPQIDPVVVIWGSFEPAVAVDRDVTYVRGDALVPLLMERAASS